MAGKVVIGRADNGWTPIKVVSVPIHTNRVYNVAVRAVGSQFDVKVTHGSDIIATFTVVDNTFKYGANGVRAFQTKATFDNVEVRHA
ncbi:hypothetical protein NLG97_g1045 [Lecanicillium saksenae]|uniref:Uncharacterized protein n=1 Tax=Lecanicillium saksenae TaxID=468837 RepID=A0ACC1R905_9HYPO|nr:hypothetical protein NLG97_g1045 [Lecanicillium saksenae]